MRVERLHFGRAPLLFAVVCFALGEAFSKLPATAPRPTVLLLFACLAFAGLSVRCADRAPRIALLPIAALWIAAGLWSAQIEPAASPQTQLLPYADGLSRRIEGRIVRIRELPERAAASSAGTDAEPDQWDEPGTPATSIDLALTAIEQVTPDQARMVPIAGGVRATLLSGASPHRQAPTTLRCGDTIAAPMRLRLPERYRDPGAWQYADFLLEQGIAATGNVPEAKLQPLGQAAGGPRRGLTSAALQCRLFAAQSWAAARLSAYTRSAANRRLPSVLRLSSDDAGMLNAMLFGDRSRLTRSLRLGFERTGSFHLFVVSGMHLALLAGGLFFAARRLRMREGSATLLTLAFALGYALLTGFGVPVQRALAMTAVFLTARLLFRERNPLNALGAAALVVLVGSPRALFEASFQMTCLAIVAIAGIAIPLGERSFLAHAHAARDLRLRWIDTSLPPRLAQLRVMLRLWGEVVATVLGAGPNSIAYALPARLLRTLLWAAELALIGLVAEAVMVLPMAVYFHRATVFALPANMVSIPLVALLAPLGVATFSASLVSSWLAVIPAAATAMLLHGIRFAISLVSRVQAADVRVAGPGLPAALAAVGCIAFCCWAVRRSPRVAWMALAGLPLAAGIVLRPEPPAVSRQRLEVTAIDVGQGDSLLVVGPGGRTMLIDAGGPTGAAANAENAASSSGAFDIGEEVVSPYLWSRQIHSLDLVVLSHAHSDHMGGMPSVLRNFHPRELWVATDSNAPAYRDLLGEAAALGIPVRHLRAGASLPWDGVGLQVLAPAVGYANAGAPANNDSLVLRLQFGRSSVLLEGDAEAASERSMLAASLNGSGSPLGPDTLLKVGHHGSRTSSTPEFLAAVAPADAVISVGRQNTFGHPRPEIVARLAGAGAHVYRTDEFGLTTFLLSPDGSIAEVNPAWSR